ncbi:MAG: class C sortase [Bulleidia sp.]
MKKKKNISVNLILVLVLLTGLSLLLYPSVSDYWNSFHQSRVISQYSETVASIDNAEYGEMLEQAQQYNSDLPGFSDRYHPTSEQEIRYESLLNISGSGVMGYIRIQKLNLSLPISHGTDDDVLQTGIGHIEGSSLPVGGESTHCVLSGHRGLPSAKLFTNLDEMEEGDLFELHILDEILTYEVDQIRIVLPNEIGGLEIEQGKDLCTLVTCTPYGVNSHRLLVRGHRVENVKENNVRVTADAGMIRPLYVAPILAIPILTVLLVVLLYPGKRR